MLLLLPISQGHEWGWTSGRTLGAFAAIVMAGVWVLTELRVKEPMVDMKMFVHRPVLFTNLAGLLLGFAMFAQFIGVSYLVQMPEQLTGYGFGASVLDAAVVYLLPTTLVSLVGAQVGGLLVRRIGARFTLAAGAAFGVAGFAWLTAAHGTTASVIGAGMVIGLAISFGYASMPAAHRRQRPGPPDRHRQRHQLHLPLGRQRRRERDDHLAPRVEDHRAAAGHARAA